MSVYRRRLKRKRNDWQPFGQRDEEGGESLKRRGLRDWRLRRGLLMSISLILVMVKRRALSNIHIVIRCAASPIMVTRPFPCTPCFGTQSSSLIALASASSGISWTIEWNGSVHDAARSFRNVRRSSFVGGISMGIGLSRNPGR